MVGWYCAMSTAERAAGVERRRFQAERKMCRQKEIFALPYCATNAALRWTWRPPASFTVTLSTVTIGPRHCCLCHGLESGVSCTHQVEVNKLGVTDKVPGVLSSEVPP